MVIVDIFLFKIKAQRDWKARQPKKFSLAIADIF